MKTSRNLYPKIYTFSNLLSAWKKARRGKRYEPTVAAFEYNLDVELLTLQQELYDETYQPGPYRTFTIHDPKRRKISAAPFRDRVVHHALCNTIEPIFERKFIFDSYANRVDKGTHRALDRCTYFMRHYAYVMPFDIQQFFPAIDHAILKNILSKTIADGQVIELCSKIINSGIGVLDDEYTMHYFPWDNLLAVERPRGLPIGNLTSQFWANVYLNELDQFVKHTLRCRAYLRYVDDFLLFSDDKFTLHQWRQAITQFLQSLRLTIHINRCQLRPVQQGLPFLGFTVYPDYRRLKRRRGIRYQRHLRTLFCGYLKGEIENKDINASVNAWRGHVMHGDTWALQAKLLDAVDL